MKKLLLLFSLFCIVSNSNVYAKYDATEFYLKNGLRVICIKKKTLPIISCNLVYNCGSKNDAISKSGAAHYLEHMAFANNKGYFNEFLEGIGAERNAFTSIDVIFFYEIFDKTHLETVLENEAIRMTSIDDIADEEFSSEKGVILEERSMAVDSKPSGAKGEVFLSNIFNRNVISYIIGWKHEIESMNKQDLIDYHRKWFVPNNATLLLVGDIDFEAARSLTEKYFSKIKSREVEKLIEKSSRPEFFKECTYSSPKNGSLASVEYIYHVPFLARNNFKKSIALQLAISVLNRPESFTKKILEHTLNLSSVVNFIGENLYILPYDIISVEICSSINCIDDCEKLWEYGRLKIINTGILQSELDEVKRTYLLALAYKKDDVGQISQNVGLSILHGRSLEEIQSLDDIVQSITVKECNELLRELFSVDPIAVLKVTPKGYDRDE